MLQRRGQSTWRLQDLLLMGYGLEGRVDMIYRFFCLHVLLLCDMEISFILANLHGLTKKFTTNKEI
jgi:hypothetical protein